MKSRLPVLLPLSALVLSTLSAWANEMVTAGNESSFETPLFVANSIYPTGHAIVFGVAKVNRDDVVLLDNGFDQGFRNGMICEVRRDDNTVGEIILVEVQKDRAAGLIVSLEAGKAIQFNDSIRIKTQQI